MTNKNGKRAWAIEITDALGTKCWLNYEHLRFATKAEAEEHIDEKGLDRARAVRVD